MLPAILQVEQATDAVLQLSSIIIEKTSNEQEEWLVTCGGYLTSWGNVVDKSIMNEAKTLYYVNKVWTELKTEATRKWQYNFYTWARRFIKRRNMEFSDESINHRIRVYREFIAEPQFEIPEVVFIPKRDNRGKPVEPKTDSWMESDLYDEVPLDLSSCEFSKLLKVMPLAKDGQMTPDLWSVVADPFSTCAQVDSVKAQILNGTNGHHKSDDFRIYEQDGIIYGYQDGRVIPVLQLIIEDEHDPLWVRTVETVLKAVGSKVHLNI